VPKFVFVALAIFLYLALPVAAQTGIVAGRARVIDGDTIEVSGERVRLYGIDAPETGQRCMTGQGREWSCGRAAADRLRQLVSNNAVACAARDRDDYGRLLGVCSVNGRELNGALVREGLAWAFVRYTSDYVLSEREARLAKRGVFAAENTSPWDFRADKWGSGSENVASDMARKCPIKGNVNGQGKRIFHLPWQHDYSRVKIDERKGERWFCTEGEAERAGWRRAAR
jgi:endonuclease YncB( thermonuclease family)